MAVYLQSYDRTLGHEGGWGSHPSDPGRETWRGMSRRHNADWPGWAIVDQLAAQYGRGTAGFKLALNEHEGLAELHRARFRIRYWSPIAGDELADQDVADELFDTAILQGHVEASEFLQRALNILNKRATLFADLKVDGDIGSRTLGALEQLTRWGGGDEAVVYMNSFQGARLEEKILRNEKLEDFAWGWAKRVEVRKAARILRRAA